MILVNHALGNDKLVKKGKRNVKGNIDLKVIVSGMFYQSWASAQDGGSGAILRAESQCLLFVSRAFCVSGAPGAGLWFRPSQ